MRFSVGKQGLLFPDDPAAVAHVAKHNVGTTLELNPAPHYPAFRRYVYAMLHKVERYAPPCNLRAYLAIVTGHVDLVRCNSTKIIVPHSLADMTAFEFEAFWDEAQDVIRDTLLPPPGQNADADALRAELNTPSHSHENLREPPHSRRL